LKGRTWKGSAYLQDPDQVVELRKGSDHPQNPDQMVELEERECLPPGYGSSGGIGKGSAYLQDPD
jgi:hypothetical protein